MKIKWLLVVLAGLFEVGWAAGLKHADSLFEWLLTILSIIISFLVLVYCSKELPATTVYAVFVGLGTAGTVLLEMIYFGEPFNWLKIALISVLFCSVIGLKTTTHKKDVHLS